VTHKPPKGPAPLCKCGCGQSVSHCNGVWNQWKQGHNNYQAGSRRPRPLSEVLAAKGEQQTLWKGKP